MLAHDPARRLEHSPVLDAYLRVFRPLAPAVCGVAFVVAWLVTDSTELRNVAIGMAVSVVAAVGYLLLARVAPIGPLFAGSLVLDELIIVGLVWQLPEPLALAPAFFWSIALAGLFLPSRAVLAMTAFGTLLYVATPLAMGSNSSPELLVTGAVIFAVIGAAIAYTRHGELLTRRALERSQRQLLEAQHVAAIGSWEWHPGTGALNWSSEMYRLWGRAEGTPVQLSDVREQLHEDDQVLVAETVRGATLGTSAGVDVRCRHADGTQVVLHVQGALLADAQGEHWGVGTAQDVTAQRRVEQLQAEFVATASHELRTPTAIIAGFADTLDTRWEQLDDGTRRAFVQQVRQGSQRLSNLIEDVLHVSRIETGQLRMHAQAFDLRPMLDLAVSQLGDGRVQVGGAEVAAVHADPERLRQVVDNLLDNALRYASGRVEVCCTVRDDDVEVMVCDDGPGIAPEQRERVFDRFTRLETEASTMPGTGLGLYIARELVELAGGTMAVGAAKLGGAAFRFTVPRADAAAR